MLSNSKKTRVTREQLFELVWSEPMIKVAEHFGVSSSYLARVCTTLNVPRPRRGYWAKLEVGKAPPQPPLPAARPGEQTSWVPGTTVDAPLVKSDVGTQDPSNSRESSSGLTVRLHSLIVGIEAIFSAGRESYRVKFLKPAKRNLPDIHVSRSGLPGAVSFANALFNALERRGHRVVLASNDIHMSRPEVDVRDVPSKQPFYDDLWHPGRQTVAYFGDVPIGIVIYEVTEATLMRYTGNDTYVRESEVKAGRFGRKYDGYWTSTHDLPTGRLCLVAYSSHYSAKWSKQWKEKVPGKFLAKVVSIAKELEASMSDIQDSRDRGQIDYEQRKREQEEYARRRAEEEAVKRKAAKVQESKAALQAFFEAVERSDRFERTLHVVREMARGMDEESTKILEAKIAIARRLLGPSPTIQSFLNWVPPDD